MVLSVYPDIYKTRIPEYWSESLSERARPLNLLLSSSCVLSVRHDGTFSYVCIRARVASLYEDKFLCALLSNIVFAAEDILDQ